PPHLGLRPFRPPAGARRRLLVGAPRPGARAEARLRLTPRTIPVKKGVRIAHPFCFVAKTKRDPPPLTRLGSWSKSALHERVPSARETSPLWPAPGPQAPAGARRVARRRAAEAARAGRARADAGALAAVRAAAATALARDRVRRRRAHR